jgi:PDZ domain-containing protein
VTLLVALVVVLCAVLGLRVWNISEYALTPGNATYVAPLVSIKGLATNPHTDKIMLTDVYLTSLSAWQRLTMEFQSHVEFVPAGDLVEPGVPGDELIPQGFLEMNDSKQAAEVAAFSALGWKVPVTPTGAVVTGVVAPSPARKAGLAVADEIVAVNGAPVDSRCSLFALLHPLRPDTSVRFGVKRARMSPTGVITWGRSTTIALTTGSTPSGIGASGCPGVKGVNRSWIGVSLEDGFSYRLPATVSINTSNIGGPSAGLAMTLTLIDELSRGSITGHRTIAATGTISPDGAVGAVGGVAEKAVAVVNAGAKVFFVPEANVADAKSAQEPGLRIIGVTSLRQVLRDLRNLGGAAPVAITKPR